MGLPCKQILTGLSLSSGYPLSQETWITGWSYDDLQQYQRLTIVSKTLQAGYVFSTVHGEVRIDTAHTLYGLEVLAEVINVGLYSSSSVGLAKLATSTLEPGTTTTCSAEV
jgi:hypothetical protein